MQARETVELVFTLLGILLSIGMLAGGFLVGRVIESRHLRRLDEDEAQLAGMVVTDLRRVPDNWRAVAGTLVAGEAVLSADRFLTFTARLQKIVGGRLEMFERLIDRARRESRVRMLKAAQAEGANAVWNVRYECVMIDTDGKGRRKAVASVCYGTALTVQ